VRLLSASAHLRIVLVGCCLQAFSQTIPPGAPIPRSATDLPAVFVPNLPVQSSTLPKRHIDPLELQREAKQVLDLSQSIQSDFESINRGMLPSETIEKLRRIEKLSKHLRSQIER